jgi:DNA repair protein RadC
MKIKDLHPADRPREKLIKLGSNRLKNAELLAILINTGIPGKNSLELAEQILTKYSLNQFLELDYETLVKLPGINEAKACKILAISELNRRNKPTKILKISDSKTAAAQFIELKNMKKEYLAALYLNTQNEIIWKETISIGILDATTIHPREIFEPAIRYLASSVLIAHNHPSGETKPSRSDIDVTKQIQEAAKVISIDLLDHLIITKEEYFSFKDEGLL